jgi:hypothetical protein
VSSAVAKKLNDQGPVGSRITNQLCAGIPERAALAVGIGQFHVVLITKDSPNFAARIPKADGGIVGQRSQIP